MWCHLNGEHGEHWWRDGYGALHQCMGRATPEDEAPCPPPSRAEPAGVTDAEAETWRGYHPTTITAMHEALAEAGFSGVLQAALNDLDAALADRARYQERIGKLEAVARKWLPGLVASLEVPDAE